MTMQRNPFDPRDTDPARLIDRERELERLTALVEGGQWCRLSAPRRYGKTTVLRRVLGEFARRGDAAVLVDLEGVLSMGSIVVRIERAYAAALRGRIRQAVETFFRSWQLGLSLSGPGFAATLHAEPRVDAETVLLRLLETPQRLHERHGIRTVVAFDEFQDLLRVDAADGVLRSVIQHQGPSVATYVFAGSAPSLMERLFSDPSRPLLEQALPVEFGPLPEDVVYEEVYERFTATGRDPGDALASLVSTSRGHPQRSILLAHHLWEVTPRGSVADEGAWLTALDKALRDVRPVLAARFESFPPNEQRVALALATGRGSLYEEANYARVGLKRGSIRSALDSLEGRGEVIRTPLGPQLTDPLLEYWLQERGPL